MNWLPIFSLFVVFEYKTPSSTGSNISYEEYYLILTSNRQEMMMEATMLFVKGPGDTDICSILGTLTCLNSILSHSGNASFLYVSCTDHWVPDDFFSYD